MSNRAARLAPLAVCLALLAPTLGACSNGGDHLLVRGSATATTATVNTGFRFDTDTQLDDDTYAPADGRTVGHCTITRGGVSPVLDVGLSRPGAPSTGGLAMKSFTLHADDTRVPAHGDVSIQLGDVAYSATTGADCMVDITYIDAQQGMAYLTAACTLAGADGTTAMSSVDLEFAGCTVR